MNLFQSNLRPVIEEKQNEMNFFYEKIDNLEVSFKFFEFFPFLVNCHKKNYFQLKNVNSCF
jgi:hypothetical protein